MAAIQLFEGQRIRSELSSSARWTETERVLPASTICFFWQNVFTFIFHSIPLNVKNELNLRHQSSFAHEENDVHWWNCVRAFESHFVLINLFREALIETITIPVYRWSALIFKQIFVSSSRAGITRKVEERRNSVNLCLCLSLSFRLDHSTSNS